MLMLHPDPCTHRFGFSNAPAFATAKVLRDTTVEADGMLVRGLFEFRSIGVPLGHHWSTQHSGADFGWDYLSRTAMAKANIFVNAPQETAYFYQDCDDKGELLSSTATQAPFPPAPCLRSGASGQ
ncbi:hypothetical protein [Streptomyces sp. NPDC057682]|uniref:hypothetical protein n=1 Tax=Streptomyces sp. NPDC057682 TaxID=3346210 RepID=UPI0036B926A6